MIVENIIPRNVVTNRGAAEVDNHISSDDIFDYHPIRKYKIYFIIPNIRSFIFFRNIVKALRDKNKSRAKCVPIYGDLYQNLQWSLTFNLKVVTHLQSASEASYDVINMATINRNRSLIKAIVCICIVVLNQHKFFL